jgi:hypothetical protein
MPDLPPVVILTSIFESNIFPPYELGLTNGDGHAVDIPFIGKCNKLKLLYYISLLDN